MIGDIAATSEVAAGLADALDRYTTHTRDHCVHPRGFRPATCSRCTTRAQAISALDEATDAARALESAIEIMLTALDEMRSEAADCAACDSAREWADRADLRYRAWLADAGRRTVSP